MTGADAERGLPAFGLLGALTFLTRVPVQLRRAPDLAASVPWFPVVGGVIGVIVGALAAGLGELVPMSVAAAIAVIAGVALTGAFHEDGLADVADAMGGWTVEQRREILKDSRHGTYGVAALTSSIVLRIVCVATLTPAAAFAGLVAAHALGRAGAVATMGRRQDSAEPGLGAEYTSAVSPSRAALGVAAGVLIAALATGWWAAPLAAAAALGALAVGLLARRALGAITGDALGAIEQVGECLVLVVVTGLATRHTLWWA
ncbi:MAG: adenosylcobinamide-GDP ribazoletransferase [Actinomycetota bacterium]